LNPENLTGLVQLAAMDADKSKETDARAYLSRIQKVNPKLAVVPFVEALIESKFGHPEEARRILAALEGPDYPERSYFQIALLYASLKEPDPMFENLRKASDRNESAVLYLKVHPVFKPYRGDPRFVALADHLGL
jgi:hypothetical protein